MHPLICIPMVLDGLSAVLLTDSQIRSSSSSSGSRVEFLLTGEVLSLALTRAELHLQLSNPQRLDLQPLLPAAAKRGLPTR